MSGILFFFSLVVLSALPLFVAYAYTRRKYPEYSFKSGLLAVTAGLTAVIPVALLQYLLPEAGGSLRGILFRSFVIAAMVEEGAKYIVLRGIRSRLDTPFAAVPSGILASLSFALFETAVFASADPSIALLRACTAAPLHAACGIWVGRAAFIPKGHGGRAFMLLFSAVSVHGAYDLVLSIPRFPGIVAVILAFAALGFAIWNGDNR
jgi:RsiW-degrading membrane proteinase PrsW (M82 family)